jgi:hypothetical protein
VDAVRSRDAVADRDDGPPLREAGSKLAVLLEPATQSVETLRHLLVRRTGQLLRALVDLDPGDDTRPGQGGREGRALGRRLADRFVEEDDSADVVADRRRREEHVPVCAPVLLGRLDVDFREALFDRREALVGGENSLARSYERSSGRFEFLGSHHVLLSTSRRSLPYPLASE